MNTGYVIGGQTEFLQINVDDRLSEEIKLRFQLNFKYSL